MTALLTDNLPLLAGAPNGIKKLRELILELAVRGKLVPQDPNDEPASELLKRIAEEKARLVAEGKIRKQKPLAEIGEEESPFELPEGWEWARLADLAFSQAGFAFKSSGFNGAGLGLPLIRIRDVGQAFSGTFYDGEYRPEFLVEEGDYLISMDGQFRVATWQGSTALLNQRVSRLIFFGEETARRFIADSLQARLFELQGVKAYTTVDHLSGGQISEAVIALPPLAEQHRIVAKVDELMTLCDRLEARQADAESAHAQLVQALLDSLTQACDAEDFAQSWQRLAEHFHTLFTTESSIDALKQTLLQLAVMGKLVPQDPNDEPAREVLKRIAEEKARLVAEGKIKKAKATHEELAEVSYEIPSSWAVASLGQVVEIVRGITFPASEKSKEPAPGRVACLRTANVQDEIEWDDMLYIRESFVSRHDQYVEPHDIVMSMANSRELVGKVALIGAELKQKTTFGGFLGVLRPVLIEPRFIMALLRTPHARSALIDSASQTTNIANVSLAKLRPLPFAIPPLAEQHRIVAKVDELMALCDQVKARLNQARQVHEQLASALVERAVA